MKETIVTDEIVEKAARSDADFDARPFSRLGRADRERYLARARAALTAVVDDLVRGEREVCAEIAEDADIEEWQVAAAIRARG